MSRFADLPAQLRKESRFKGAAPRIGVSIAGIGKYFSPHDSFTTDTTTFDGLISGGFSIKKSVPRLGGLGTVSSLSFTVLNEELFSDLFASGSYPNPENEEVNVYLYYDDGTAILDAEREEIFRGMISDFPNIDFQGATFQVESTDLRHGVTIGTVLANTDGADGVRLPEDSLGKIKPIIYGDHSSYYGHVTDVTNTTSVRENNFVPCVYLGVDSLGNHRWWVAGHKVDSLDKMWAYHSGTGRMMEVVTFTIEQNTSSGCIISTGNNPSYYDYWYGDGTVSGEANVGVGDWTNDTRAGDKTLSNYAESVIDAGDAANTEATIEVDFSSYNPPVADASISAVAIYAKVWWTRGAGLTDAQVEFYVNFPGSDISSLLAKDTIGIIAAGNAATADEAGANENIDMTHYRAIAGANTESTARVYEIWKRITFTDANDLLPLYFGGTGKDCGSWINNRGTGEDFTESHADDANVLAEIMPNKVDRDFSGASAWADVDLFAYDETGDLTITAAVVGQYCTLAVASAPMTAGKRYRLEFDVANIVSTWTIKDFTGAQDFGIVKANGTDQTIEFTVDTGLTGGLRIVADGATSSGDFDNFSLEQIVLAENATEVIEDILLSEIDINAEQTEHLNETDFATHAKWDVTGQCSDAAGNAKWVWAAGPATLAGTLTQTAANRATAGENSVEYRFKYTCAVTTAPDGDFALAITNAFAANNIPIPFTAGTHEVVFISNASASTADFVISGTETTATEGEFTIDDVSLVVSAINVDSFNIASNDLSTSVLSFAILEQTDSDELLDGILKTVKSVLYYNNEDKATMRTFVSTDGFGLSANNTPAAEDIYEFDPHTHFKIVASNNDGLRYQDSDGDTYTATMTAGDYAPDELAVEIATQMNASSTPTLTCTYSSATGKFTITDADDGDASDDLELYWTNAASTIGETIGFNVGADDTGGLTYTSDYAVWDESFVEHPIAETGFALRKTEDPIYTDVTVNYYKSYQSGNYQATTNDTDVTYHAESLKGIWSNDYTRDATTAQIERDFLLDRHMKKYYVATVPCVTGDLSPIGLERWDHLNARHPILNGIFGTGEETQKWLHLSESLQIGPRNISLELGVEEV